MAYSSIMGADEAPEHPSGRGSDLLGPSDNSDTGSDTVGTHEAHADTDSVGTGERANVSQDFVEGADIMPDRVLGAGSGEGFPQDDVDAQEFTDIDADEPPDELDEDAGAA
jgi:hypothetical protein